MYDSAAFDVWLEEARIAELQKVLLKQGRKRLGSPSPIDESALVAVQDLDRLERIAEAVLTATSWEELLATL